MLSPAIGFDRSRYIEMQSQHIKERRESLGGRLYLEMGGKLFDDLHASRVLPGFTPDNKIAMLENIKDEVEIMVCINAKDLERGKMRADLGISYEDDVLRLVDVFRDRGFLVDNVVLTQCEDGNKAAQVFQDKLTRLGLKVTRHFVIEGYPADTERIVSPEGLGRNEYAQTSRDLIIVTAPGPGSGKLATCLSQIYHEHTQGIAVGYAKFETFPIWNIPLDHPVNAAYEAATADLDDVNMIDPFHLATYGTQAVNYNRDVEVFPLLKHLLEKIAGHSPYESPTDMGVNMVGYCISNDEVCREAAKQEIIRRYYKALVDEKKHQKNNEESSRIRLLMGKQDIHETDRPLIAPAREIAESTGEPGSALMLHDGTIITGKTSPLLGCSAAMLLNALKHLAGISPEVDLLAPSSIAPIQTLKTEHLGSTNPRLHTDEVLIALSVSADHDENARRALDELHNLRGLDVHTTTILGSVDEAIFRNLDIQVTSDPVYQKKSLFRK